jgi:hypothetical protein
MLQLSATYQSSNRDNKHHHLVLGINNLLIHLSPRSKTVELNHNLGCTRTTCESHIPAGDLEPSLSFCLDNPSLVVCMYDPYLSISHIYKFLPGKIRSYSHTFGKPTETYNQPSPATGDSSTEVPRASNKIREMHHKPFISTLTHDRSSSVSRIAID